MQKGIITTAGACLFAWKTKLSTFRSKHFPPFSLIACVRSPEGLDGQPPALPPKQLSRKTLSQIIQAHSQQSLLDNHLSEMYDVPVNADKTTVSIAVQDSNTNYTFNKVQFPVAF